MRKSFLNRSVSTLCHEVKEKWKEKIKEKESERKVLATTAVEGRKGRRRRRRRSHPSNENDITVVALLYHLLFHPLDPK